MVLASTGLPMRIGTLAGLPCRAMYVHDCVHRSAYLFPVIQSCMFHSFFLRSVYTIPYTQLFYVTKFTLSC